MKVSRLIMPSLLALSIFCTACKGSAEEKQISVQPKEQEDFKVIAYYTPETGEVGDEQLEKLDQIIYSFLYLDGNHLSIEKEKDSLSLSYLTSLKKKKPALEVLISLGGWGGCETCSEVFSGQQGRKEFSESVRNILVEYNADGIDLDWEYPAIEGYPGHPFKAADKENFTSLIRELRRTLGEDYVITFAAGGFNKFLKESVEWEKVMPLLDWVNLMSYDLGSGKSGTAHHTPLFSTAFQTSSADNAFRFLDSLEVPVDKIVIGAAFYARIWETVDETNNGLYQPGEFKEFILYKNFEEYREDNLGFEIFWDSIAHSPYGFNPDQKLFATYDDSLSVAHKTEYAMKNGLRGIMFWQLSGDKKENGLLEAIDRVRKKHNR